LTDTPPVTYLALLRHRDFARLWAAQVVSLFGGVEHLHPRISRAAGVRHIFFGLMNG
jgi:hypothetical protein